MLLLPVYLWSAISAHRLEQVEIPVLHKRASRLLAQMPVDEFDGVTLKADDEKSVIRVEGDPDAVRTLKTFVALYDVLPRRVGVSVKVDSILDKRSFETSAYVYNNSQWKTWDSEIEIGIAISARINDDNSVTFFIEFSSASLKSAKVVCRLSGNQTQTFSIGKQAVQAVPDFNHLPKGVNPLDPKVRITPAFLTGRAEFGIWQ